MSRISSTDILKGLKLSGLACLLALAGACRQDMHDQPKYEPLEPSAFFEDGRGSRPPVEGTVARGYLREDAQFFTGRTDGGRTAGGGQASGSQGQAGSTALQAQQLTNAGAASAGLNTPNAGSTAAGDSVAGNPSAAGQYQGFVTDFPVPITEQVMDRGEERYNIFCSVCHSRTGDGNGMVVKRGYRKPPSFHEDRLRQAPVGYYFDVITNGFGAMPDYSAQLTPRDRWAVIAYLRALQRSQQGTLSDVPEDQRGKLGTGSQRQEGNQQ